MPARENEQQTAEAEAAAPEVAPAPPEAAKTEFSSEGDLPAVAQGSGAAATGATASTLAFDGATKQASGDTSHLDRGVHHWEEYKASCEAAGKPEKWKDYYRSGHTEAKGWTQPYENRRVYEWDLKKGTSASQAVQDFLKGPTIADYRVAAVADDLDELRDEFGDQKFDKLFGSANSHEDSKIPSAQRLRITAASYSVPLIDQMKQIAREAEAAESPVAEAAPAAPQVEALVEEKPKAAPIQDQEPAVIAQELGLQQQDRELV